MGSEIDFDGTLKDISKTIEKFEEAAKLYVEACGSCNSCADDDDINNFRDVMQTLIKEEASFQMTQEVLTTLKRDYLEEEGLTDERIDTIYKELVEQEKVKAEEYLNEGMVKFDKYMSTCKSDVSQTIEVEFQKTNTCSFDPWTKKPIVKGVQSKICGHVYDESSVNIFVSGKGTKCPYVGCKEIVNKNSIVTIDND